MNLKNTGFDILLDGKNNKSVAFTREEREMYGLTGLLPYSNASQDVQVKRIIDSLKRTSTDIEKYILLSLLHDRNERLFYRLGGLNFNPRMFFLRGFVFYSEYDSV